MPAKRIAAMGRSYRYPQANRRNCPSVCCATARRLDDGGSLMQQITGTSSFCSLDEIRRNPASTRLLPDCIQATNLSPLSADWA
jgi:hypothetical protein